MSRIPLSEQIAEVEREIRQRARRYPDLVEAGRLKPETADAKLAALRAAQSTLVWLEGNMSWIKPEASRRAMAERQRAEIEEIEAAERAAIADHPVTQDLLAAFPGAEITSITATGASKS